MNKGKNLFMAMALTGGVLLNMTATTHAAEVYHPVKSGGYSTAEEATNTGIFTDKATVTPIYHPVANGFYKTAEEATNTGLFAADGAVTPIYHPVKSGSYRTAEEATNTGIFLDK